MLQVSRPARTTLPSVPNNLSFELVVGVRSLIAEHTIVAFATSAKLPSGQYMPADDKLYIMLSTINQILTFGYNLFLINFCKFLKQSNIEVTEQLKI